MASPREQEAVDYLAKNKIVALVDNLTSMLFFHRPERPREFLIAQLEHLKASDEPRSENSSLFNESNLDAVFGILDPTNQGHITYIQYKEALTTLGIKNFKECPDGVVQDRISLETFQREAKEGLLKSSGTFQTY